MPWKKEGSPTASVPRLGVLQTFHLHFPRAWRAAQSSSDHFQEWAFKSDPSFSIVPSAWVFPQFLVLEGRIHKNRILTSISTVSLGPWHSQDVSLRICWRNNYKRYSKLKSSAPQLKRHVLSNTLTPWKGKTRPGFPSWNPPVMLCSDTSEWETAFSCFFL